MGAVAACLAIVIAVDGILAPFSGGMIVSAYAYGTDEEITTAGAVMNSGTISDSGEMKGQPLMFYLSGKDIAAVRFSCKNQQINFWDWTEKRDEYGNAQNFTVAYGEDESEYYYLTISWVPNAIIRELTDNEDSTIAALPEEEQVINIFMELSALGIAQPLSSNILEFMKALPVCAKERGVTFSTPTDIITKLKSVDQVDVPYPMSWIDEERDISPWLGNVMQREAFNKLYSVAERVHLCDDRRIKQDWDYLQASNNFRFMTTKNTGIWLNRGIYDSPYDAFTNYMNILGDFISRVNSLYPVDMDNEELNSLLTTIKNQGEELVALNKEVERLQAKLEKAEGKKAPAVKKEPAAKKPAAAKKAAAKKPVAKKAASKKEE